MKHYIVYWMLVDMGKRKFGHDTVSSEEKLEDYEVMDMMGDVASQSDEKYESLEKKMPNFVKAHGEADNPEDWKVRSIRQVFTKQKEKAK